VKDFDGIFGEVVHDPKWIWIIAVLDVKSLYSMSLSGLLIYLVSYFNASGFGFVKS